MTRLPIIRTIKPNTFNVGRDALTPEKIAEIKAYYWREWHIDWKEPGKVIDIESHEEIVRIMQEKPQGRQAIVGNV